MATNSSADFVWKAKPLLSCLQLAWKKQTKCLGWNWARDDYLTKPFGMRELLARVRAVLRRAGEDHTPEEVLRVGAISLDRNLHAVKVDEQEVDLTPSEFDLLAILMSYPGRVFSRMELLEHLQGTAFEGVVRTIDVHIRNLRTKIEPDPANPFYIETVYGVGYRFQSSRSEARS